MGKLLFIVFHLLCFSTIIANSTIIIKPKPIRVYEFVVTEGGTKPTTYEVARSNISTNDPTSFGIIFVVDEVLRAGPDPNSQILGRNQGTCVTTGLIGEPSAVENYNFGFTTGKYKGSSLIVAGQRLIFVPNQEIPIVGGTGVFRGAKGYAISSLISSDQATFTFIFQYDIYLG